MNIDILVIGGGPAGVSAASILSKNGRNVTLVAKQLGGAYCYEGSVISNSLVYISSLYEKHKLLEKNFLENDSSASDKFDLKKVRKFVESNSTKTKKKFADELEKNNVKFIEGVAEFTGMNSVNVKLSDGTVQEFTFDKCVVAVGSTGQKFNITTGKKLLDTSAYSNIERIPSSVTIIGGGLAGVESATFFSRFGSKVNIIEKNERILTEIDIDVAKRYEDCLEKKDIKLIKNKVISKIERIGQKYIIFFDDYKIESEEVFLCIGRKPAICGLNLEAAGVKVLDDAPICGDDLKTDNENIYVAGDVASLKMHAGWAYHSAYVVAKNILGKSVKYAKEIFPITIAVDPEIAFVGLTEEDAKKLGYDVGVIKYTTNDFHEHCIPAGSQTFIKTIYNKADKKFLGVQVIGAGATDIMSIFALAMQSDMKSEDISELLFVKLIHCDILTEIVNKVK